MFDGLVKRVKELEELKALLKGQVESLANQVCCCGEIPVTVTTMVLLYCFLD